MKDDDLKAGSGYNPVPKVIIHPYIDKNIRITKEINDTIRDSFFYDEFKWDMETQAFALGPGILDLIYVCVDHVILTGFNIEIGVEYQIIFDVLCSYDIHFGASSRFRKDCVILAQNLHSNSFFFTWQKTRKVNKYSKFDANFNI